ncbi:MAG: cupredoxin domain-containing protein [Chloroflexi bacterium]|nr:cupredoxin domain-containing protein [Chloroflexota bacterium]
MNKFPVPLLTILLLSLLLASCTSEPPVRSVLLLAEDIAWSQNLIEAKVGQTVELTLRNDGALDHDFVLEEFGLEVSLSPGEQQTVSFVLTEAGLFDYICSVPGHQDAGMAGKFAVTE